ncbi:biofilm regulation protein kinase SiaB [Crenobacter intestini]|uniref:Uncharacterized protein n=1 Tax=Crenobacter intestini TaxID=2563443 RepID=A0A4T0V6Y8_9NEIS|nr:biofilm regulation protein kinase SiaB [Crenobacter intestini]TIC87025.1 hypothetical protein E5K04_01000 [Crenobacter intestini]
MKPQDLLALRETFDRNAILMSFNGPFSATLIEEIGLALRRHLEALEASPSSITDVFAIYIELTQNIRHYTSRNAVPDVHTGATLVISHRADGRYEVCAGNVVQYADGEALLARVEALAELDKAALKAAYKAQLRAPIEPDSASGAGLGLIDIARRASQPPAAFLQRMDPALGFFSLQVVI